MKRLSWITIAVLFFAGATYAAPALDLDGRMFIWTSQDHSDNGNWSELNYIDWTAGVPGSSTFLAMLPDESNDVEMNYNNAHLMNNGNVLGIVCDNNTRNQFKIYEIHRNTGTATVRYDGTSGNQPVIGYLPCIALDPDNNRIVYNNEYGWSNIRKLEDTNNDGNYDTASGPIPKNDPGLTNLKDAHLHAGKSWSIGKQAYTDQFIGYTSDVDNYNVAFRFSDWDPNFVSGHKYAEGDQYLWAGDPDGDWHTDVYFTNAGSSVGNCVRRIWHFEDADDNGYLEMSEYAESFQVSESDYSRDLVGVTDGDKWMLVFADSDRHLRYINLLDNGSMDETGFLLDGVGARVLLDSFGTSGGQYIMMDQTPIPEPTTLLLLGTGTLTALGYLRRRRMR